MNDAALFKNDRNSLPNEPTMEVVAHFDRPIIRDAHEITHAILEYQIADTVTMLDELRSIVDETTRAKLMGEINGLCCALRSISGSKYWQVNFFDPVWVAAHRSKR